MRIFYFIFSLVAALYFSPSVQAQEMSPVYYDIGTPTVADIYIDPISGNDSNSGASRTAALKTVTAAWNSIPQGVTLTGHGYRLLLLPGNFNAEDIPNYWESRYGTAQFPIILQAADGQGTVRFSGGPNVFDCRYVYFININMTPNPAGDAFHCEQCQHLLLRGVTLNGAGNGTREAQEALKINQSQYVYLENNNISGATDNAIDFVAVQYGHVVGNKVHNSEDWCMYAKGGSAYLRIEGNEFYDCGTGGFTAGQGTGFEFMSSPWIHYEAYDIKFVNNIIHDTQGAGFGVNGGYNILFAHNTLYKVGSRSHGIEAVYGARSCDGNSAACEALRSSGGWGLSSIGGDEPIPNRNISILNNILYNPMPFRSSDQLFAIYGPRTPTAGSNISSPATTDTNLKIQGNVIWNGPGILPLGIDDTDQGCQPGNASCNATQLTADNSINTLEPQFTDAAQVDFRPLSTGNLIALTSTSLTAFSGGDRESTPLAPEGVLTNLLDRDRGGTVRSTGSLPGAYGSATSPLTYPLPEENFPTVPIDPENTAPVIGTIAMNVKVKGSALQLTVTSINVTDNSSVARVSIRAKAKGARSYTSFDLRETSTGSGRYSGKKKLKGKSPARVEITAVDNNGLTSTKVKSVKVRR